MAFSFDIEDDVVRRWSRTSDDVTVDRDESYTPSLFVAADDDPLTWLRDRLASDPKVRALSVEPRQTSLHDRDPEPSLRVGLDRPSEIDTLARENRTVHEPEEWAPGTFRLYNVDLSPTFRYCLETETDPTPANVARYSTAPGCTITIKYHLRARGVR